MIVPDDDVIDPCRTAEHIATPKGDGRNRGCSPQIGRDGALQNPVHIQLGRATGAVELVLQLDPMKTGVRHGNRAGDLRRRGAEGGHHQHSRGIHAQDVAVVERQDGVRGIDPVGSRSCPVFVAHANAHLGSTGNAHGLDDRHRIRVGRGAGQRPSPKSPTGG